MSAPQVPDLSAIFGNAKKLQEFVRGGVPAHLRKEVWTRLALGERELNIEAYSEVFKETFGEGHSSLPDGYPLENVPDFGSPIRWQSPPGHVSREVMQHVHGLMVALAVRHPSVSYCPFLVDLAAVLLRSPASPFALRPCQAFAVLSALLERSSRDHHFFPTTGAGFTRLIGAFVTLFKQRQPKLEALMDRLAISPHSLFAAWYSRLFGGYMPLQTRLRLMDVFFLDGCAIFGAAALAILNMFEPLLLRSRSARQLMYNLDKVLSLEDPDGVVASGLMLNLNRPTLHRMAHSHAQARNVPSARLSVFNIPRFRPGVDSGILTSWQSVLRLWTMLPQAFYIQRPVRIFNSETDGYNLTTLIAQCGRDDEPHFVLAKAPGAVVGVFMTQSWRNSYGTVDGRCFVFSLEPTAAAYRLFAPSPGAKKKKVKSPGAASDDEEGLAAVCSGPASCPGPLSFQGGEVKSFHDLSSTHSYTTPLFELMERIPAREGAACITSELRTLTTDVNMTLVFETMSSHLLQSIPILSTGGDSVGRYTGTVDVFDLIEWILSRVPPTVLQQHPPTAVDAKPLWKLPIHSSDELAYLVQMGKEAGKEKLSDVIDFALRPAIPPLQPDATMAELILWFSAGAHRSPMVDSEARLTGVLSQSAVLQVVAAHADDPKLHFITQRTLKELGFVDGIFATMNRTESVLSAIGTIAELQEQALAIIDNSGALVGNFSATDVRLLSPENWAVLVSDVVSFLRTHAPLSLSPVVCSPEATLGDVISTLVSKHIRRVWIVDDKKKPVGLVTSADVMDVLAWHFDARNLSPSAPAPPDASPAAASQHPPHGFSVMVERASVAAEEGEVKATDSAGTLSLSQQCQACPLPPAAAAAAALLDVPPVPRSRTRSIGESTDRRYLRVRSASPAPSPSPGGVPSSVSSPSLFSSASSSSSGGDCCGGAGATGNADGWETSSNDSTASSRSNSSVDLAAPLGLAAAASPSSPPPPPPHPNPASASASPASPSLSGSGLGSPRPARKTSGARREREREREGRGSRTAQVPTLTVTDKEAGIGDATGVAFALDASLRFGFSRPTVAYGNPSLVPGTAGDGRFQVLSVEAFTFER